MINIISVRKNPDKAKTAIEYIQKCWADDNSKIIYEDCILSCLNTPSILPQWYLMYEDEIIIGCAGLIPNDFISRMDLWPWICSLYIDEQYRGNSYGSMMLEYIKHDAKTKGFSEIYLCTSHIGFYEKYGFEYLADGYHLSGKASRIYKSKI